MGLINVYSRSPICHIFNVVLDDGREVSQIIEGMNKHVIYGANIHGTGDLSPTAPRITQMEEDLFNRIKATYLKMGHVKFFGGKDISGITQEPLIYTSKNEKDALKQMQDFKPIITDNEMAIKSKNIERAA